MIQVSIKKGAGKGSFSTESIGLKFQRSYAVEKFRGFLPSFELKAFSKSNSSNGSSNSKQR